MAQTDYEEFPKGKIAVDGGELQDCHDVVFGLVNGRKPVHTFRKGGKPSGSTGGAKAASMTFKMFVSRAGFERDFLAAVDRGTVKRLKFKVPGKVITTVGPYTKADITTNLENAVEITVAQEGADYSFG